jgi:IS30 family transposase
LGYEAQKKMVHLTLEQRYKIEAYRTIGESIPEIATRLGKCRTTIWRELDRYSDKRDGLYKAEQAHRKACKNQAAKAKRSDLNDTVKSNILHYLGMKYSPEQMVGRAKIEGREMVSAESIYKFVWADKKKGGRLHKDLRSKGKRYTKRRLKNGKRGVIVGRVDIEKRPAVVEQKERFGDLEIDLVIGKGHKGALLTINDRSTGLLFMDKVQSKEASVIEAKAVELLKDWKPWIKTITSDNGKEFSNHKAIANELDIDFFFAKPYHSWERGANRSGGP